VIPPLAISKVWLRQFQEITFSPSRVEKRRLKMTDVNQELETRREQAKLGV